MHQLYTRIHIHDNEALALNDAATDFCILVREAASGLHTFANYDETAVGADSTVTG